MTRPLSPHVAEKVVFAGLEATIATYKFGTMHFGRCEMCLEVLPSGEDLVGRTDAAMVRLGTTCVFILDVVYELVCVIEASGTMTAFMRLRGHGADRAGQCRRAQ